MSSERPVAVVTGGGSGIGRAVVEELAQIQIRVVAVDLDMKALKDIAHIDGVLAIHGDVSEPDTWGEVLSNSAETFSKLPTQFVSCAAVVKVGTTLTLSDEDWSRTIQVNLMGAVHGAKALIPGMIDAGKGSIVTIASVDAFLAEQGLAAYCASKGALLQYTKALALDHARDGIRANCVAPGITDTPLFRYHVGTTPNPDAVIRQRLARQPDGRFLDPVDVARVTTFLLSDAAVGITGALVPVDGGLSTGFDFTA